MYFDFVVEHTMYLGTIPVDVVFAACHDDVFAFHRFVCGCVHDSGCFDSGFSGIEGSVQRFISVVRHEHSIGALVCFAFKR